MLAALVAAPLASASTGDARHTYTNAAGSRSYVVHVPAGLPGHPALVVVLHGCGYDAVKMAAFTGFSALADQKRFVVAYPEQPASISAGCWDWFHSSDQQRDAGEPSIIAGITRQVAAALSVNPRRIYVAGHSAGGYMADIMAVAYPDLYAAVGIVGGGPYATTADTSGRTPDVSGLESYQEMGGRARPVPAFIAQGTYDCVDPYPAAVAAVAQWLNTDDWADDGLLNGSVSRVPASTATYGVGPQDVPAVNTEQSYCSPATVQTVPAPASVIFHTPYPYTVQKWVGADQRTLVDFWTLHGMAHEWPNGQSTRPGITAPMWAFFAGHSK